MERDFEKFITLYKISKSDYDRTGYKWEDLLKIADNYDIYKKENNLEDDANSVKKFIV